LSKPKERKEDDAGNRDYVPSEHRAIPKVLGHEDLRKLADAEPVRVDVLPADPWIQSALLDGNDEYEKHHGGRDQHLGHGQRDQPEVAAGSETSLVRLEDVLELGTAVNEPSEGDAGIDKCSEREEDRRQKDEE
jgi:hypothetical protein